MIKLLPKEKLIKYLLLATASTSILVVILIFTFLAKEALPFAEEPGLGELLKARWIPVSFQRETFGILPLICGSLLITAIATILMIQTSGYRAHSSTMSTEEAGKAIFSG